MGIPILSSPVVIIFDQMEVTMLKNCGGKRPVFGSGEGVSLGFNIIQI